MKYAVGGFGLPDPLLYAQVLSRLSDLWFDIDHRGGRHAHLYFMPDAELQFADAKVAGAAQIRKVYDDRRARGPRLSRHLVTNLRLFDVEPGSLRALSNLLLFGDDGVAPRPVTTPAMVGDVWDELVQHGDQWLISSRRITYLFIEPETELAVPDR